VIAELISIALHDPDRDWAESECCNALQDARIEVRIGGDALDDWMIFGKPGL
jgi:hypothetical protein